MGEGAKSWQQDEDWARWQGIVPWAEGFPLVGNSWMGCCLLPDVLDWVNPYKAQSVILIHVIFEDDWKPMSATPRLARTDKMLTLCRKWCVAVLLFTENISFWIPPQQPHYHSITNYSTH